MNNNITSEDIFFRDVFTETGSGINIEANNLNINCLTSISNKFMLDTEGNLSVNSITTNESINNTEIFNLVYPVGSIYLSVNNINPSTLFGGTWIEWAKGRSIVGIDTSQSEFNTVEKTGGAKTHTLNEAQMPNHTHQRYLSAGIEQYGRVIVSNSWSWSTFNQIAGGNTSAGGNQPHNNLQPYITCYMWKRIS